MCQPPRQRLLPSRLLIPALVLLAPAAALADTAVSRTFVNGTATDLADPQVRDLHIEYSRDISDINLLSQTTGITISQPSSREVEVVFDETFPQGASISLQVVSPGAGQVALQEWWWTDGDGDKVARRFRYTDQRGREREVAIDTYGPNLRGDEASLPGPPIDAHSIVNKGHHWGGSARHTSAVTIQMDVRPLLADPPSGMDVAKLLANIEAVIEQWTDCTRKNEILGVPKAGQNGVPANSGGQLERDPAVMAPGPTHNGVTGVKFRSVTSRECSAAFFKYPHGLTIELITEEDDPDDGDIRVDWGMPRDFGRALGAAPSEPFGGSNRDKTRAGHIWIRKNRPWYLGMDTDGDGYITNKDDDTVPEDEYDFYSIFKHECGHIICMNHTGENYRASRFEPPAPSGTGANSSSDERSPSGTSTGDPEFAGPESYFFASDRAGGFGGYDIWKAEFDVASETWVIENLGAGVNTSDDELDPHLASDGTYLLFASDRLGGAGGFDVYETILDLDTWIWDPPAALGPTVNSAADERHPSLPGDMRTLYFSSDRSGGFGLHDIWVSERVEDVGYADAENLGDGVNTADDERDPSISADNSVLYFASDRLGGLGGYDLWRSELGELDGWTAPEPLTALNSANDDVEPHLGLDHRSLVFASDRPGGLGAFDLYEALVDPWEPDAFELFGVAEGGSVDVTVTGPSGTCFVSVATSPGETAEEVAAALAAAMDADPCLASQGIETDVSGSYVIVIGVASLDDIDPQVNDPGLTTEPPVVSVPAVAGPLVALLAVGLAAGGALRLARSRAR